MPKELGIKVEAVYIGDSQDSLVKTPVDLIEVNLEGIVGDKHGGFTKKADSRDRELFGNKIVKGQMVRNWRQWSGLETSEMARVARNMGLDSFDPAFLGPNVLFSGIEGFTQLPKGSTIWFPEDAVFYIEGENLPCIGPGEQIAKQHPEVNPSKFVKAAMGLRGLVGTVYRPGVIRPGELAVVHLYEPRSYSIPSSNKLSI